MDHYAGIDVSLECSSVCVVDAGGKIVREGKIASEPEALIAWFGALGLAAFAVGWRPGRCRNGFMRTAQRRPCGRTFGDAAREGKALSAMPVKTDRNDARGIAQLMRLGWFRPVHCKSLAAQEVRAHPDRAQAGAIEAVRCRDEPARDSARLWAQSWAVRRRSVLPTAIRTSSPDTPRSRRSRRRCYPCTRSCCASSTASRSRCARWRATIPGSGC